MLLFYRRQCKLLWKGDRSFLPAKKKPTARVLVRQNYVVAIVNIYVPVMNSLAQYIFLGFKLR